MTRGHPPHVAIGEAERKARMNGLIVFALEPEGDLPFHFVICDRDCISLVRVRRLKYPGYEVGAIEQSCKNDIAALRAIPVTLEIFRELWVRGPDRHWYRYLVLPGSVEALEDEDDNENNNKKEGGVVSPALSAFPVPGWAASCPSRFADEKGRFLLLKTIGAGSLFGITVITSSAITGHCTAPGITVRFWEDIFR